MSEESEKTGGVRDDKGRFKPGCSGNYNGMPPETEEFHNKKIAKKEALKELKQRIMRSKEVLLNSQMNLAQGVQMLFKSKKLTIEDKDGNAIEIKKEKPVLVESQSEIESYLAGEYDDDKDNYYFITVDKPDNKAIDSMFDRAFDKPRQNVGLDGGEEGEPISLELRTQSKQAIKELLDECSNNTQQQ